MPRDADAPALELVERQEVMRRLRRGDLCYVARVDGQIAAYAWTGRGAWILDDVAIAIPLRENEGYLYDVYAKPLYRGQNLFYPFMRYIWEQSVARGAQVAYARIRRRNIAAIAGMRYFRSTERLELRSTRLLSVLHMYRATAATESGLAMQRLRDARPQIGVGMLLWSTAERRGARLSLSILRGVGSKRRHSVIS